MHSSPNIIREIERRRMRWVGHVAHMEHRRHAYSVSVGISEWKTPLGRPSNRWEDYIKVDLQ
jgi:hypothetical protein